MKDKTKFATRLIDTYGKDEVMHSLTAEMDQLINSMKLAVQEQNLPQAVSFLSLLEYKVELLHVITKPKDK